MLFENEPHYKFFKLIASTYLRTRRFVERQCKPLNMTYPQLGALIVLTRMNNISQRELADILETDTTTAMVLCDSLEKKGWLVRLKDKTDRRVNRLMLTDSGREVYKQASSQLQAVYDCIFNANQSDELNEILPSLEKVNQYIKEVTKDDSFSPFKIAEIGKDHNSLELTKRR
jgi:DNA-binding MarR family transcriptional regulator